jgi:hypothetical protein
MDVIISESPVYHEEVIKEDNSIDDLNTPPSLVDKIKQDDLDTPTPSSLAPPPPYSQWDELSIEQLLEKSREVLNTEGLDGDKKEKDGEVLDKMTQLESLVSSLQTILSDQTFAMHDLRSQLSDVQTVLKKMQDKQDTISSEEVMKQVMTMKALTENIIAASEIKKQLDVSNAAKLAGDKQQETAPDNEKSTEFIQQPSSTEVSPPTPSMSRTASRQPSRNVSRAPSRHPSRPSSKSGSRTVSPAVTPVSLSRTSSRSKFELPSTPALLNKINDFPTIDENCEKDEKDDDDDESCSGETALDRLIRNTASLLTEATEAVELKYDGQEKFRALPSLDMGSVDFDEFSRQLDEFEEEDDDDDDEEEYEESPIEMNSLSPENEDGRWPKKHKRTKSGSKKDEFFLKSLTSFSNSMTDLDNLFGALTEELPQDEGPNADGIHYNITDHDLIHNPSSDVPDLDDFAQQCRLLTRALILPFLQATHSFMSESLQTSNNIRAPRSVTSTTRTFMNLMYWTFLFTLGSLVLDAWLCEVAGRQVIRMVELLKPGQPFGFIANGYGGYVDPDQQDGGIGLLDVGKKKKKNVKFRTGPKMKAVSWKGSEKGVVGNGKKWLKGIEGVLNLGGRWGTRSTVGRFDEEYSEESDEWEIVDFDSSDGEDSVSEEEVNEDDPALLLRRRITNERLRRAGHVNDTKKEGGNAVNNDVSSVKNQECDIQDAQDARKFDNLEDSALPVEPECDAMEDDDYYYYYYNDDDDLNIPGSFPTEFKWTPPQSKVDITDRVRRVRSVVLCKPKRNGPFGGSGGFWVMNTRKVRTINKGRDVLKSSNKPSPIIKNKSSIQKRTWVRRYSI